jgi:hypothetical protein
MQLSLPYASLFSLLTFILVLFFRVGDLHADNLVSGFIGVPDNDRIYIRWNSGDESQAQLIRYELYRRTETSAPVMVTTVTPRGSNQNYEYVDMSALSRSVDNGQSGTATASRVTSRYFYTLKIITQSGQREIEISVTLNTSGFRRTWGSLKAFFR